MKLKKIASLALAGLMAVGMLAGCAGAADEPEQPATTSNSVSAAVVSGVNADAGVKDAKVTVTAGTDVTSQLEGFVKKYSADTNVHQSYDKYTIAEGNVGVSGLNAQFKTYINAKSDALGAMTTELEGKEVGTTVTVSKLYAVNASVSNDAITDMVVKTIAPVIKGYTASEVLKTNTTSAVGTSIETTIPVNYNYTVSVSVVEDSFDYSYYGITEHGGAVKYVAIVITGTSTMKNA